MGDDSEMDESWPGNQLLECENLISSKKDTGRFR